MKQVPDELTIHRAGIVIEMTIVAIVTVGGIFAVALRVRWGGGGSANHGRN
jgi:hypothetical protein